MTTSGVLSPTPLQRAVTANENMIRVSREKTLFSQQRSQAIAEARLAGMTVPTIAKALVDPDTNKPMSAGRVQQIALKELAKQGKKAPRGNGEPKAKKAASSRPTKKAAAKKTAAKKTASKATAGTKATARKQAAAKKTAAAKVSAPKSVTGDKPVA